MRKYYRLLVLMLILISIGSGVFHAAEAENMPIITDFTVTDLQGNPISSVANQHVQFRINAKFNITANQVSSGDQTVIVLPDALVLYKSDNFEIKDDKGESIAIVEISKATKTLTLTYLSYVDEKSQISGEFHLYVIIDEKVVTEVQTVQLDFKADGLTVNGPAIEYKGPADYKPIPLAKYGYFDKNNPQRINYYVYINTTANTYKQAIITDILRAEGMNYDQSTFRLYTGTWERIGKEWKLKDKQDVSQAYSFQFNGPSFSFELGDINSEGYYLTYSVDLSYVPVNGEVFQNFATLESSEEKTVTATVKTTYMVSGSTGTGYSYSLHVHKTDALDKNISLEGATFDVIRIRSNSVVGTITTDSQGKASIGNLLFDDYTLIETQAPTGYQNAHVAYNVLSGEFDPVTKDVMVQISNMKLVDPVVSITGTKTWIDNKNQKGVRPESIELILFGDDQIITVEPLWIKEDDVWQYTYSDLPQFINNQEVVYRVQEVAVSGYKTSYNGFHIINMLMDAETPVPHPELGAPNPDQPDTIVPNPSLPNVVFPTPIQPENVPINPQIPPIMDHVEQAVSGKQLPDSGISNSNMLRGGGFIVCGLGMLMLVRRKRQ